MKRMRKFPLTIQELVDLYTIEKLTTTEIAKKIKWSSVTIQRRLRDTGVLSQWVSKWRERYYESRGGIGTEYADSNGRIRVRGVRGISTPNRISEFRARLVVEKKLGKPIPKGFDVHHKDENVSNDELENLELKSGGDHARTHRTHQIPPEGLLRELYYSKGLSQKEIADQFKVWTPKVRRWFTFLGLKTRTSYRNMVKRKWKKIRDAKNN